MKIALSKLCRTCNGKCCVGEVEVFKWDAIYSDQSLTMQVDDNGLRDRVMKVDSDNNCVALIEGKCSIYEKRPTVCRRFTVGSPCCIDFCTGEKIKHACVKCDLVTAIVEEKNGQ